MSDTRPHVAALVAERHRRMTPSQRVEIAAAMFDTARAIVESSLPPGLSQRDRRLALARRLYGNELPETALLAFAEYPHATVR